MADRRVTVRVDIQGGASGIKSALTDLESQVDRINTGIGDMRKGLSSSVSGARVQGLTQTGPGARVPGLGAGQIPVALAGIGALSAALNRVMDGAAERFRRGLAGAFSGPAVPRSVTQADLFRRGVVPPGDRGERSRKVQEQFARQAAERPQDFVEVAPYRRRRPSVSAGITTPLPAEPKVVGLAEQPKRQSKSTAKPSVITAAEAAGVLSGSYTSLDADLTRIAAMRKEDMLAVAKDAAIKLSTADKKNKATITEALRRHLGSLHTVAPPPSSSFALSPLSGLAGDRPARAASRGLSESLVAESRLRSRGFDSEAAARAEQAGAESRRQHREGRRLLPSEMVPAPPRESGLQFMLATERASRQVPVARAAPGAAQADPGSLLGRAVSGFVALEHRAKDLGSAALGRLPSPVRVPIQAGLKAAYSTYLLANKAVQGVARERGFSAEEQRKKSTLLSNIDAAVGMKALPWAVGLAGGGVLPAVASSFLPVASMGWLGQSFLRSPLATSRGIASAFRRSGQPSVPTPGPATRQLPFGAAAWAGQASTPAHWTQTLPVAQPVPSGRFPPGPPPTMTAVAAPPPPGPSPRSTRWAWGAGGPFQDRLVKEQKARAAALSEAGFLDDPMGRRVSMGRMEATGRRDVARRGLQLDFAGSDAGRSLAAQGLAIAGQKRLIDSENKLAYLRSGPGAAATVAAIRTSTELGKQQEYLARVARGGRTSAALGTLADRTAPFAQFAGRAALAGAGVIGTAAASLPYTSEQLANSFQFLAREVGISLIPQLVGFSGVVQRTARTYRSANEATGGLLGSGLFYGTLAAGGIYAAHRGLGMARSVIETGTSAARYLGLAAEVGAPVAGQVAARGVGRAGGGAAATAGAAGLGGAGAIGASGGLTGALLNPAGILTGGLISGGAAYHFESRRMEREAAGESRGFLGHASDVLSWLNIPLMLGRGAARMFGGYSAINNEPTRPMFSRQLQIGESAEDIYNRAMMTVGNMTPEQQQQEAREYQELIRSLGGLRDDVNGLREDIRAANPPRSV